MTTTDSAQALDELRQVIADQMRAICAKDLDRLMSHYATEVVVFNVKPPLLTNGTAAWRRAWETDRPYLPDSFRTEMRDLSLAVRGREPLAKPATARRVSVEARAGASRRPRYRGNGRGSGDTRWSDRCSRGRWFSLHHSCVNGLRGNPGLVSPGSHPLVHGIENREAPRVNRGTACLCPSPLARASRTDV